MLISNYAKVCNAKRDVSLRSIKRTNLELMRNRINKIVVNSWNEKPRLVKK